MRQIFDQQSVDEMSQKKMQKRQSLAQISNDAVLDICGHWHEVAFIGLHNKNVYLLLQF